MIDFLIQTQEKVSEAIENLNSLAKEKQSKTLHDQVCIASCKSDLVIAQRMLHFLIDLHTKGDVDLSRFLIEYLKTKSNGGCTRYENSINHYQMQNLFEHLFDVQLN